MADSAGLNEQLVADLRWVREQLGASEQRAAQADRRLQQYLAQARQSEQMTNAIITRASAKLKVLAKQVGKQAALTASLALASGFLDSLPEDEPLINIGQSTLLGAASGAQAGGAPGAIVGALYGLVMGIKGEVEKHEREIKAESKRMETFRLSLLQAQNERDAKAQRDEEAKIQKRIDETLQRRERINKIAHETWLLTGAEE